MNVATLDAVTKNELIVADYNAIEARGTAWLAGAKDLLGVFARNEDPYLYQACKIYKVPQGSFTKKDAVQRQLGKKDSFGLWIPDGLGELPDTVPPRGAAHRPHG